MMNKLLQFFVGLFGYKIEQPHIFRPFGGVQDKPKLVKKDVEEELDKFLPRLAPPSNSRNMWTKLSEQIK